MSMKKNEPPKKAWNPWEVFDSGPRERKAAEERAAIRAPLKAEWQKKVTNPYGGVNDYIFDPAIQRFHSMKATQFDHFKATPKTGAYGLLTFVLPAALLSYWAYQDWYEKERKYQAMEIPYKDRPYKFI